MTDHSDFLTETEKQHLAVGINDVRRAQVLAGVAELARTIGDEDRVGELVVSVREQLTEASPKQLKKLGKHVVATLTLIKASTPAHELPQPDLSEVLVDESAAEEISDEEEVLISSTGVRFLKKALGDEWWQELGFRSAYEATPSAVAEVMVRNANVRRPTTIEEVQETLERYLSGTSIATLGEQLGKEPSGISMKLNRIRDDRRWQHGGTPAPHTEIVQTEAPSIERAPVDRATLMARWADTLGFTAEEQARFASFLDPNGDTKPSDEQIAVIKEFARYITARHTSIDSREFQLSDVQKSLLRHLTGEWYRQTTDRPVLTTPKPLAKILEKTSAKAQENSLGLLNQALQKMLRVDSASSYREVSAVTQPQETEVALTPRMQNNQKILDEALFQLDAETVPDSVWREVAFEVYLKRAPKVFTDDEALGLWSRLHFDEEGTYNADITPIQREALKKLQQRFFEVGRVRLLDKQLQQTALRVMCNMSQGVNSLDDVELVLQKQQLELTKEHVQRYVVDGVLELLR